MTQVPDGYKEDGTGALRPVDAIKKIDLLRDDLVMEIVNKAKVKRDELVTLKAEIYGDIESFVDLSSEQYGVKRGGKKGNVTLTSFDGKYKIIKANADNVVFDERLQAAKALIDECLADWSKGAHPGLVTIVNDAFRTDQKGELRTNRVLALRRHDINDIRWKNAMDAIADSLQVVGSKTYIRVYERIGQTDRYKQIPLDIAAV
ncbi:sulfate transporter [Cellvibrio mixtus]|uniref:Sulfate transporter n=1 Tax=Cellvibrio mixtus TaxID=39650 RepID=A0A266Q4S8_9GAMM|nr:DUF3164 family protein [Cellvibrio mixtus]OZY84850.1 sulfate transporter [Cellvibrio mixtus]